MGNTQEEGELEGNEMLKVVLPKLQGTIALGKPMETIRMSVLWNQSPKERASFMPLNQPDSPPHLQSNLVFTIGFIVRTGNHWLA